MGESLERYQIMKGKDVNGNFELLGALCFPPGTRDDVVFSIIPGDDTQPNLLFYDDEASGFIRTSQPQSPDNSAPSCKDRERFSKTLGRSTGVNPTYGLTVDSGKGQEWKRTVPISEKYYRKWYFVLSNCNLDKDGNDIPINIEKFLITSTKAVSCDELYQDPPLTGYIVTIVFLSVIVVALSVTVGIFYSATRRPKLDEGDLTGYNEL